MTEFLTKASLDQQGGMRIFDGLKTVEGVEKMRVCRRKQNRREGDQMAVE